MKHVVFLIPFTLATATVAWQPAPDSMLTEWGAKVTPENAWREYPRPQMQREQWINLNGLWDYTVTKLSDPANPAAPDGQILVPFPIESALSGVKRSFQPDDVLWYRRTFEVQPKPGRRYLLNFEAVDYQCMVRVNNHEVGSHTGGNLPFSCDITDAVKSGVNTVILRVTDATDTAYQLHGKQRLEPKGIWYTPVSGIWQTVWLEEVPDFHVTGLRITTRIDGTIAIGIDTAGHAPSPVQNSVIVSLGNNPVAGATGSPNFIALKVPEPKLWSPGSPTLYDLKIQVGDDVVKSYGGLPKDKAEWLERYRTSMQMLGELRKQGISAGIYTQTSDVEGEINGLLTYDRKVRKVPAETLRTIHREAGLIE